MNFFLLLPNYRPAIPESFYYYKFNIHKIEREVTASLTFLRWFLNTAQAGSIRRNFTSDLNLNLTELHFIGWLCCFWGPLHWLLVLLGQSSQKATTTTSFALCFLSAVGIIWEKHRYFPYHWYNYYTCVSASREICMPL